MRHHLWEKVGYQHGVSAPSLSSAITHQPSKDNGSMWSKIYHYFMFIYHYFMFNHETYMEHFHKRSNVESAFSMIKGKFGAAVRSKSDEGQVSEVLCKMLCHNVCVLVQAIHELGIEQTFGKGLSPTASATTQP